MRPTVAPSPDLVGKCLREISPDLIFKSSGVIVFACGDGRYDHERETFLREVIPTKKERWCIHRLFRHGGFLQLHPDSPTNRAFNDSASALAELRFALEEGFGGEEGNVLAMVHAPCGKALEAGLANPCEVVTWAKKARGYVLDQLKGVPINLKLVVWFNYENPNYPDGLVKFYEIIA